MKSAAVLTELIDDMERLGNKLIFIVNVSILDLHLSERARNGLLEFGVETIQSHNAIEDKIQNYRKSCAPS